jgi:hypothetical protein
MGATDTLLPTISWLALYFNPGYLIIAGILLQIRGNYTGSIGTPAIQRRKCRQPQKATRTEVKPFASEISLHLLQ